MFNKRVLLGSLVAGAFVLPSVAGAAMTGVCSTCHTMHNSINGTHVATGTTLALPNTHLLKADCAGCHADTTVDNSANGKAASGFLAPQVDGTATAPNRNAGGFFEAGANQGNQHNVLDIWTSAGTDTVFDGTGLNTIPGNFAATYTQTTCQGCHGGSNGHHAAASTADKTGTVASSYRLLGTGGVFVDGQGVADFGTNDATVSRYDQNATNDMNKFCGVCHPNFHGESAADTDVYNAGWIRHPQGVTLNSTMDTAYAASAATAGQVPIMGTNAANSRIVMCISCHRPHGSEYSDLLRFSYTLNSAGNAAAAVGCETCHSIGGAGY